MFRLRLYRDVNFERGRRRSKKCVRIEKGNETNRSVEINMMDNINITRLKVKKGISIGTNNLRDNEEEWSFL